VSGSSSKPPFGRWGTHFYDGLGLLGGLLLALMTVAVFVQVLLRYVFTYAIEGLDEVPRYLFVWLVMIGAAESGFATMQSTLVLLSAHEDRRGGAMGILSACIGTQPLGTLWLGLLATGIGVAAAMALNSLLALAAIAPVAMPAGMASGKFHGGITAMTPIGR